MASSAQDEAPLQDVSSREVGNHDADDEDIPYTHDEVDEMMLIYVLSLATHLYLYRRHWRRWVNGQHDMN